MNLCQICQQPIWENEWPNVKDKKVKKFVCFYCYSHLKNPGYKPRIVNKSDLIVCDRCGEVSDTVKKSDSGWLCEYCREQ